MKSLLTISIVLSFLRAEIILDFKNVVDFALQRNTIIQLDEKMLQINQITWKDYLWPFLPTANISVSSMERRVKQGRDSDSLSIRLSMSQLLFDGGRQRRALILKQLGDRISFKQSSESKRKFILQVINSFLAVVLTKEEILIQNEMLTGLKNKKNVQDQKYVMGEVSKIDVLELISSIKNSEINLLTKNNNYSNSINSLKIILSLSLKESINVNSLVIDFFKLKPPPYSFSTYWERYKNNSIALMESKAKVKELALMTKAYKEKAIPQFKLSGWISLSDEDMLANQILPREKNWGLSINCIFDLGSSSVDSTYSLSSEDNKKVLEESGNNNLSLFQNKDIYKNIRISKIEYLKSKETLMQKNNNLLADFQKKCTGIQMGWKKLQIQQFSLSVDKEKLDLYKKRYLLGEEKFSDYLDQISKYTESKIKFLQEKVSYMNVVFSFESMLGMKFGSLGMVIVQ